MLKIKINGDKELVNKLREEIQKNGGYCPCAIQANEDTRCMCKEFREQTIEGFCHCGLYYKEDDN